MARNQLNRKRKLKKGIAVLGEGRTEQYYLKHLKERMGYKYAIRPYLFDSISLNTAERIIDDLLNEEYGLIVFFTDYDTIVNQSNQVAFNQFQTKYANHRNVLICESMPSIEYWFLLHFVMTTKEYVNADQVMVDLRNHIPEFGKNIRFLEKSDWVQELLNKMRMDTALVNAQKGLMQKDSGNVGSHFPFTKVHLAINAFENDK